MPFVLSIKSICVSLCVGFESSSIQTANDTNVKKEDVQPLKQMKSDTMSQNLIFAQGRCSNRGYDFGSANYRVKFFEPCYRSDQLTGSS